MERPLPGRRRILELGAGLLGAAALPSCAGPHRQGELPQVELKTGSFVSAFRPGTATGWSVAAPASAGKLPVAVFLHGTGSGHGFVFGELGAQSVLQRHVDGGGTPFAIAAVDGGDSWWHARADGTDTQSMLLAEFLPLLAGLGLDTVRIGLFGLSMGGFGVLLLASQDKVPGLRAVAAMSPAVWDRYEASREHAFDGPEDFAANDVFTLRPRLAALPKRIDCGTEDDLLPTTSAPCPLPSRADSSPARTRPPTGSASCPTSSPSWPGTSAEHKPEREPGRRAAPVS
jgi:pimeloyl-ACP methyl ester carboxylesterase